MRRGATWAVALALCVGGTAACGDDSDGGGAGATTSTTGPTSSELGDDLAAAVDEFCAQSEEVQRLFRAQLEAESESAPGPVDPATAEATEERLSELTGQVVPAMMTLQRKVDQMLPGDAARFQECAAVFGDGVEPPP